MNAQRRGEPVKSYRTVFASVLQHGAFTSPHRSPISESRRILLSNIFAALLWRFP